VSDDRIAIALPEPDTDATDVITTPVAAVVGDDRHPTDGHAMVVIDETAAELTAEQCFNLSDTFNSVGEALRRYHDE
jgi:hypothetical protein